MDFTMDLDKFTYLSKSLESVSDELTQYIEDYKLIIDELASGWEGLAKEQYFILAFFWIEGCLNLINDINDFKEQLDKHIPDAGNLLDRGKALTI